MARKNSAARRRNAKGRLDRRQRGEGRAPKINQGIERVHLEDLILPDGQCLLNPRRPKASFATKEKATKALEQAQKQRARMGSAYSEKRFYKCPEGGCGGYHLTSREEFEARRS